MKKQAKHKKKKVIELVYTKKTFEIKYRHTGIEKQEVYIKTKKGKFKKKILSVYNPHKAGREIKPQNLNKNILSTIEIWRHDPRKPKKLQIVRIMGGEHKRYRARPLSHIKELEFMKNMAEKHKWRVKGIRTKDGLLEYMSVS